MPAECTITRPASAGATFNESTAQTAWGAPGAVYGPGGACRVGRDQIQDSAELVADRKTAQRRYTVVIPAGTDEVQVDDIMTITSCVGDPALEGKPMQVVGAARGSTTWERVITCQLQQPVTY